MQNDTRPIPESNGLGKEIKAIIRDRCSTQAADECWEWQGSIDADGYGRLSLRNQAYLAHRVSYVATNGQVPDGLPLDHLCKNRACVNPEHLEPVTPQENNHRTRVDECYRGHPMSGDNARIVTRPSRGYPERVCRACDRINARAYRARKRSVSVLD